jgi:hypothetical protein
VISIVHLVGEIKNIVHFSIGVIFMIFCVLESAFKLIFILILILLLFITLIQGIYSTVPNINHVFRVQAYNVAAVLWLRFCGTCNVIFHVKCFILLHQYFPKYVCR